MKLNLWNIEFYVVMDLFCIIVGAIIFIIYGPSVIERLRTEVNGVVISKRDIPEVGASYYMTEYNIRGQDDKKTVYIAKPTAASLPRSMPIGTHIRKNRWNYSYERDGIITKDFPSRLYNFWLLKSVLLISWGIGELIYNHQKRKKAWDYYLSS